MIGYISIGSYRIKGDDWQSHPLREVVSTVPLYEFRPIISTHHIMGSLQSALFGVDFCILGEKRWGWAWWSGGELLHL